MPKLLSKIEFYPLMLGVGHERRLYTREELYAKIPCMRVTYLPATNPHPEDAKEKQENKSLPWGGQPTQYYVGGVVRASKGKK